VGGELKATSGFYAGSTGAMVDVGAIPGDRGGGGDGGGGGGAYMDVEAEFGFDDKGDRVQAPAKSDSPSRSLRRRFALRAVPRQAKCAAVATARRAVSPLAKWRPTTRQLPRSALSAAPSPLPSGGIASSHPRALPRARGVL
jgi:hypothetical protein